ncbi:MAG TPA: hypothetical protein VGE62_01885 [Candidatus Paceibacterota bacterium]
MFKAVGLVIGLIAIRVLMPDVFNAFQHAAIAFFSLVSQVFAYAPQDVTQLGSVGYANYVPQAAPLPAWAR